MKDINIAGAGISGLTAAIILGKQGYKVNVYEAQSTVGKRFNGDIQGIENWSDIEDSLKKIQGYGLDINFEYSPAVRGLEIWGPNIHKKILNNIEDRPFYYMVQRGDFEGTLDRSLLQQALAIPGVTVFFDKPVRDYSEIDIVATGPIAKDKNIDMLASGYTFDIDLDDMGVLIFDEKIAPDGYGYFLVMNGKGVIATCIMKNYSRLNEYRESLVSVIAEKYDLPKERFKCFNGFGNFYLQSFQASRMFVGEAGGFQDFNFGFGMKYAMESGYLAAQSIIHGDSYEKNVKDNLLGKLKASIVIRYVFMLFNNLSYPFIISQLIKRRVRRKLYRLYNWNILHWLIYPIARRKYKDCIKDPRIDQS